MSEEEAKYLGLHIQRVNKALRDYWNTFFPNDRIERIYSVYFNESPYINHLEGEKLRNASHVHIHLLPRTKKMGEICQAQKLGWDFLETIGRFPKYVLCGEYEKKALIKDIEKRLKTYAKTKNE